MGNIMDDPVVLRGQARAWFAVIHLCDKLGMKHVKGCSGLDDVLTFIRGLIEKKIDAILDR